MPLRLRSRTWDQSWLAQFDIDAGGRLVEHQDRRRVDHGLGHHQPASHAAGQGPGIGIGLVGKAQGPEDRIGLPLGRRHAVEPGMELEQLARREEGVDVQLLGHHADGGARLPRLAVDVEAPDLGVAAGLDDQAREDVDQRRLAGAVGPKKAEQGAARHIEIDGLEGPLGRCLAAGLVGLVEAVDRDGKVGQRRRGA